MNLSDVLVTPLLAQRMPSVSKMRRTASALASPLASESLVCIARRAREACGAESAGISIFRKSNPIESRWIVATGVMSEYAGSGFPLRHSLCGVTAELRLPQLFAKPQRYFKWIDHAGIYISEALVTPLIDNERRLIGTIWVMSHRGARPRFDGVDARNMSDLAMDAARALLKNFPPNSLDEVAE